MQLVIATRNPHKLEEIREILEVPGLGLRSLEDYPDAPEVEEDGATFEDNAIKKARTVALHLGQWCLADDSGLEVDALGGAPGVHSARYAGTHGADDANNQRVLNEMKEVPHDKRSGRFRCAIALSDPEGECKVVSGAVEGAIADGCYGSRGFGYDVLFIPRGYLNTFGVLEARIKHRMSHRGNALRKAMDEWGDLLGGPG